jgi:vancomycin resistance protein YoaR
MIKRIIAFLFVFIFFTCSNQTVFAQENVSVSTNLADTTPTNENSLYTIAGNCTTSTKGSSSNRINNIAVAASRLNGLVIQPGEAISVSTLFLQRTAENGYQKAGTYYQGKVIQATGGGICQVSSTVYNAVMNAGLLVVMRFPHSMPVSYLPLGMDAAISAGSKDLIFLNPYETPILIQTITENQLLTVNVYVETDTLKDRRYEMFSKKTGDLSAETYLNCYQNNELLQTLYIGKSTYRKSEEE